MKKPRSSDNLLSLSISSGLDQPTPVPALNQVLDQVDKIISHAVKEGEPEMVFRLASSLSQVNQLSGMGLAKTLWRIQKEWGKLGKGRGSFEEEMFRHLGKAPDTIRRYVLVWEMFSWIDPILTAEIRERLQTRPIADLIAMAQTMKQHGILTKKMIDELSKAPDQVTVRNLLREFTGREAISSGLQLRLSSDGTLEAWEGGDVSIVGFIRNRDEDLKDPIRSKAVARLMKGAGIRESWKE